MVGILELLIPLLEKKYPKSGVPFEVLYRGYIGLYGDNGKENGNNYLGFRVSQLGVPFGAPNNKD